MIVKYGNRIMEKVSSNGRLDKLEKRIKIFLKAHYIGDGKKKKLSSYSMVG